jgi:hypothetical protein
MRTSQFRARAAEPQKWGRFRRNFRFRGGRFSGLFGRRIQTGYMPIQIPLDPGQYLALLALVLAYLTTYW